MLLDATHVTKKTAYETLPEGEYFASVDDCKVAETKDKTGKYLKMTWKIHGPTHAGRLLFANYNFQNKSAKAVEIGLAEIKEILTVAGRTNFTVQTPAEFLGITANITVKIATDSYGEKNVIAKYRPTPKATATTAATQKTIPGM